MGFENKESNFHEPEKMTRGEFLKLSLAALLSIGIPVSTGIILRELGNAILEKDSKEEDKDNDNE